MSTIDAEVLWRARHGQYACLCCGTTTDVTYVAMQLCKACWLSMETQKPPLGSAADVEVWLEKRRRKLEGR